MTADVAVGLLVLAVFLPTYVILVVERFAAKRRERQERDGL